jgi:hypothetical protein
MFPKAGLPQLEEHVASLKAHPPIAAGDAPSVPKQ